MMMEQLFTYIDKIGNILAVMSDEIFDNPEIGYEEYKARDLLTKFLADNGFEVEHGAGGLATAFKAVYQSGAGGPAIGLLCEYDAVEHHGHVCGHHMQGPAIIGATLALKDVLKDEAFRIVVYGTPGEETFGGKIDMLEKGCFRDIDVALMFHAGPTTTTDVRSLAMSSFAVKFHGKSSHAAISPHHGRSALDALLLAFNAIEFMREHVKEDTRIHYTITNAGGPDNVVPAAAAATFSLRSYDRVYLDTVIERFKKILDGAALMTETTYTLTADKPYNNKIPVYGLNELLMKNAALAGAERIRSPREKTGSTDFGNVMHEVPGTCIRVAFVAEDAQPHSNEFYNAGKSDAAHRAIIIAAKALAASAYELIADKGLMARVKDEFAANKANACALAINN